jgi:hypothetical protein
MKMPTMKSLLAVAACTLAIEAVSGCARFVNRIGQMADTMYPAYGGSSGGPAYYRFQRAGEIPQIQSYGDPIMSSNGDGTYSLQRYGEIPQQQTLGETTLVPED